MAQERRFHELAVKDGLQGGGVTVGNRLLRELRTLL
jgi:hypothetical protein